MVTDVPRVTVVVPVRDEAERLADCLDGIAVSASDLGANLVEVLVVDGGSTDGTIDIAQRGFAGRGWWGAEVLTCAAGDRSSSLNIGLLAANAPILVRVDARSRVPIDYLRRCVELLASRPDLAVVGGRQWAVVGPADGPLAAGVARALNNRWGTGLSRYRRGGRSGVADTVYLGAYRTAQVRHIKGWRTDLAVNEDFDLNRRLGTYGSVWFDAGLTVGYVPRASFSGLARQYWAFGTGKAHYWWVSGDRPQPRQVLLLAAPLLALLTIVAVVTALGHTAGALVVAAALALGMVVEVVGADGPRAGVQTHLAAVAVLACISGSWLAGVAGGTLRAILQRRPAPSGRRVAERAA